MMSDIFLVDTSLDTLISQLSPPPPPVTDSDGMQPSGEGTPLSEANQEITVFILDDTESDANSIENDNNKKDDMTWLIVLVVIIVLFIVILLLLAFWWYIKKVCVYCC